MDYPIRLCEAEHPQIRLLRWKDHSKTEGNMQLAYSLQIWSETRGTVSWNPVEFCPTTLKEGLGGKVQIDLL